MRPPSATALTNREALFSLGTATLALVIGGLCLTLLYVGPLLWTPLSATGDAAPSPPVALPGKAFTVRLGRTKTEPGGALTIVSLAAGGRAQITNDLSLEAADYPFLALDTAGWQPGLSVYLVWMTAEEPGKISTALLPMQDSNVIRYQIGQNEAWRGQIVGIGIGLAGDLRDTPFQIRKLSFRPRSPILALESLWQSWTTFASWDQTSINFIRGTQSRDVLPPTPMLAAWAGLSLLALALLTRLQRPGWHVATIVLVVAVPWLTLDGLWQYRLTNQLDETAAQFAGKSQRERHLGDWDAALYRDAEQIKALLPAQDDLRLFLLHDSTGHNSSRLRLQYYLLPVNILNFGSYPLADEFRDNDYVLLLGSLPQVRFNAAKGRLLWSNCYYARARLIDSQRYGQLLKMLPGPVYDRCERDGDKREPGRD